jgi:hypothetical protein
MLTEQQFEDLMKSAKPALHTPKTGLIYVYKRLGCVSYGSSGFFPHSESYDLHFCNADICYLTKTTVRIQQPTKKQYWTVPTALVFSHDAIKQRACENVSRDIKNRLRCEAGGASWGESAPEVSKLEIYLLTKGYL